MQLTTQSITKFLNHRRILMERYGAHSNMRKWDRLTAMQRHIESYPPRDTMSLSKWVVDHESDLILLLPGNSSRFRKQAQEVVELIKTCKNYITNQA